MEVVQANPERYRVVALSAMNNDALLISQALAFKPEMVVICCEEKYANVKAALAGSGIRVLTGEAALCEAASLPSAELCLPLL